MSVLETGIETVETVDEQTDYSTARIMQSVRMIGGAMIGLAILVAVLTEVFQLDQFSTDADGNYSGPFGGVLDSLTATGPAALGLLVIGLLVVAANAVMQFFGGQGF
jgi:hypothetical protein